MTKDIAISVIDNVGWYFSDGVSSTVPCLLPKPSIYYVGDKFEDCVFFRCKSLDDGMRILRNAGYIEPNA